MKQYSFLNTIMVVNGIEITGWDEGDDAISIKRRNDSITDKVGAGGEMMVTISADRSGEFTFKLLPTSSSNLYLNSLLALAEGGADTFVPVSVRFMDCYRMDIASGTAGYIKKPADMTRGAQAGGQEWTIVTERLDLLFGA